MARRVLATVTMTALLGFSFLLGSMYSLFLPGGKTARKVGEVTDKIRANFPEDIPPEKLERAAVEGMLRSIDRWGEYFTATEWAEWRQKVVTGKFHGVGIRVEADAKAGYLRVTSPMKGTPAYEAGVLPGDLIVAVDGVDVHDMGQEEVISRIKGDLGTKVVLKLRRGDKETLDVSLSRAEIKVESVKHRMAEPGIGYIRIDDFTESVPADVEEAYRDLEKQGMTALVIDLRFNGGGLLKSAVDVCDLWLPAGQVVVMSEGKLPEYRRKYLTTNSDVLSTKVPKVILVNRGTASASEIVAAALRDHGLAPLVGSRTFGKGLVQTPFDLSDGSHLKLTTARWLTPKGEQVGATDAKSEGGLVPEFLVEMTPDEEVAILRRWMAEEVVKGPPIKEPPPKDFALEAGIEVLRAKLENRPPKVVKREIPKTPPKEAQ
jgi:carboxyl-terminal processing protease